MFGSQVGLIRRGADEVEGLGEVYDRDLFGHDRQLGAHGVYGGAGGVADLLDHGGEGVPQQGQDIAVVVDKPEFGVEGDVFREVSGGVVGLGAEDWADFVDPLEDSSEDLFVELG